MFHAQLSALMERTKCLAAPGAHQERLKLSRFESEKDWMISVWSAGEAHCSLEFYLLRFENTCTRCAWLQHLGIPPQWSRHAWRFAVHTPPFGTLDRASVATFTPQSRGCGWIFEPAVLGKPLVPRERHPWAPTPTGGWDLQMGAAQQNRTCLPRCQGRGWHLAIGTWSLSFRRAWIRFVWKMHCPPSSRPPLWEEGMCWNRAAFGAGKLRALRGLGQWRPGGLRRLRCFGCLGCCLRAGCLGDGSACDLCQAT